MFESCARLFEGNASAISECYLAQGFGGGILGGLLVFGILIMIFSLMAIYIYHAISWYTIAKKLKHKNPWLAWIPFASSAMRLELGGFHWAWIFLIFIPILGWIALMVLLIISHWRIFEKRKYPGWFSLFVIVPRIGPIAFLVVLGFVAFKDRKKQLFR